MTIVVHKVVLPNPEETKHYTLPYGFIGRHVALQNNRAMFWFEVSVGEQKSSTIEVICVGTGWNIEDNRFFHIGTIVMDRGLVWHYYAKYINE